MKNSIKLIAIFLLFAMVGRAQITQPPQTPAPNQTPYQQTTPMHAPVDTAKAQMNMNASNTLPDGYILKDGKVQQVKGGVLSALTQNIKLANGTWVMTDGSLKDVNGKVTKLQEGQEIQTDGKLITPPNSAIPHD